MRSNQILRWVVGVSLLFVLPVMGQQQRPVNERSDSSTRGVQATEPESPTTTSVARQDNQTTAPHLVKFSGVLTDPTGKPLSGPTEVTFKLYKQETDEEALWIETQSVEVDKKGRYTVLLGATQAEGLPVELFSSAEAHWLGVEVQGQPQQSRTLLVSVPYALKAVDAEKLAGKSVSDFVLAESLGEQVRQVIQVQGQVVAQPTLAGTTLQKQSATSSTATSQVSSPGPKFPPTSFSGTTTDQIVLVQQNGSGNGLFAQTASSTGNSSIVGLATSTSTSNNQNGVIGFNAGAGAGVAGIATNATAGVGVYGQGANFAGVFGNSVVNSGFANGVFGQTASPGGSGVLGIENATTGFNSGVSGQSASTNGTGVFGSSFQWVGVGGQATAPSGGPAFGVWGDSLSTGGTGVAGFADATSGYTNGVSGQSVSPNGNGVFGVNNAATGGNGVLGVSNATSGGASGVLGVIHSTSGTGTTGIATASSGFNNGVYGQNASNQGYAVHGDAIASSGNAVGVFGTSTAANGGIGVWGVALATSGDAVGVRGDLEVPTATGAAGQFLTLSPNSVAGQFANFSRQGLILQGLSGPFDATQTEVFRVDSSGNLHITGNLTVDGTKSSTAKLQDGREVALYAVESPENWFEDFGSGELREGVAWVPFDASFAQAVNAAVSYHVFLTPNGDSNGLYVARKTASGFEVREHGRGTSTVAFDYRVVARRRGYETIRMLEVPERKTLAAFRSHVELGSTRLKVEPVRITLPGTPGPIIRQVPARPIVPQIPKLNVPRLPQVR